MPTAMRVEIQSIVTPGVWTDVTSWVDWSAGASTRYGRTSPYSAPQPASLNLTLANDDGRFTPLRQVLADGVTAHPYWPNLIPRQQIRVAWLVGATAYYIYQGRIKGWPPGMRDGFTPRVVLDCTDDSDRLSRVKLAAGIGAEVLIDRPVAYWTLGEAVGSIASGNSSGVTTAGLYVSGSGAAVTYGVDGPGTEQGSGVSFAQGKYLGSVLNFQRPYSAFTLECWCQFSTVNHTEEAIVELVDNNGTRHVILTGTAGPANGLQFAEIHPGGSMGLVTSSAPYNDGQWHHVAIGMPSSGGVAFLYVDGVAQPFASSGDPLGSMLGVRVSQDDAYWPFLGNVAHVAVYDYALSATRILAHAKVAQQSAETVSAKVKRFLSYAGYTAAGWNIDTSTVLTGTYAQDGKDIAGALQDMAITEGGGAVFYFTPDGLARFTNRDARAPAAPALTVDAAGDLDGPSYAPGYDDSSLANRVTGTRATASGSASTQLAYDQAAMNRDGVSDDAFTSYAASDTDVLGNAQLRLAQQKTPAFRLPQVTVDLTTATTAGLYAAVAAAVIGARIRVTGLYAAASPATQLDVIIEGWADSLGADSITRVYDTSPADIPTTAIADNAIYGRAQARDDCALNAALTAAATTVVIACPTGPRFTTAAGDYPLSIVVETEHIQLNNPPSGSTSPQTFTGVTRAVDGTTAVAHASGAQVNLWPTASAAL